jgi:catechol 2,3-dioxygenase-like lactoylglutathione lyase family enzyme/predicted nucleotidyltransferase
MSPLRAQAWSLVNMTDTSQEELMPPGAWQIVQRLAQQFAELPQVVAVVLAGSRAVGASDQESDFDLYVYTLRDVPVEFRRSLLGEGAEIDNRFWEPGDEWCEPSTHTRLDIMYRSPGWIEDQLDRVLVRHEAAIGYSTCFWYNIIHSEALLDPRSWYHQLQNCAHVSYPEGLRRAVVKKNWPILRRNHSSYRRQIELALNREDAVSGQHRLTVLLASFFDVWFAIERQAHPGEKRLLTYLPKPWASLVRAVLGAQPEALLREIDALLDPLDTRVIEEGLLDPVAQIEHAAAWVFDLERARGFYERWFKATAGARYSSSKRDFTSYFLTLGSGARLEVMSSLGESPRLAHLAVSVGSSGAVDRLVKAKEAAGVRIVSGPGLTGDGYYEALVTDTEGNLLEITP